MFIVARRSANILFITKCGGHGSRPSPEWRVPLI